MAGLSIREHTSADLERLAEMNRALMEDQGSRRVMDLPFLRARFLRFTSEGRSIDVFERAGRAVGFASHREEETHTDPSGSHVRLHQFYVERSDRRRGMGREAFRLLAATRWRPGVRVVLDVLETNEAGREFWTNVGFRPYSTTMELFLPPESPVAR